MLLVGCLGSSAHATLIEFEPGVTGTITATGQRTNFFGSPHFGDIQYVEDGLTVDATSGVFHLQDSFSFSGTTALKIFTTDAPFGTDVVARFSFGGAAFDVLSADTRAAWGGWLTSSLGGSVFTGIPGSPTPINAIDFTQLGGWTGITWFTFSVEVTGQVDTDAAIDNLLIQPSAIPEPSTLTLLGIGLVVLARTGKYTRQ
jgi:hypothetical protein